MNDIKKKAVEIHGIFSTPIYKNYLNREFSQKEISFFEKSKKENYKNLGNTTSLDTYILNNKELKNLKDDLNFIINDYYDKIICPKYNVFPFITQSWLNWTKQGEHHHNHNHPNSILSGVLYINADADNDNIDFINEKYEVLRIETNPNKLNPLNARGANFKVETGMVILFPSKINHSVTIKNGDNTRISLAFNSFVRGTFGEEKGLTELKL
jgi:uncharacterized protein (TIGR02466 family)